MTTASMLFWIRLNIHPILGLTLFIIIWGTFVCSAILMLKGWMLVLVPIALILLIFISYFYFKRVPLIFPQLEALDVAFP